MLRALPRGRCMALLRPQVRDDRSLTVAYLFDVDAEAFANLRARAVGADQQVGPDRIAVFEVHRHDRRIVFARDDRRAVFSTM